MDNRTFTRISQKRKVVLNPEVVLIIKCEEIEMRSVQTILKEHMSLGVGRFTT